MLPRYYKLFINFLCFAKITLNVNADSAIDFGKDVYPLLHNSCLRCHAAPYEDKRGRIKKPRGALRLDTEEWIMTGYMNDEGILEKVVIPGKSGESELYTLTVLPEDHDDIMPSSGEPLSQAQTEILRRWIDQGAKFGNFKAPKYVNPKSKMALKK